MFKEGAGNPLAEFNQIIDAIQDMSSGMAGHNPEGTTKLVFPKTLMGVLCRECPAPVSGAEPFLSAEYD